MPRHNRELDSGEFRALSGVGLVILGIAFASQFIKPIPEFSSVGSLAFDWGGYNASLIGAWIAFTNPRHERIGLGYLIPKVIILTVILLGISYYINHGKI